MDLFAIQKSKDDKAFITKSGSLELEVAADIIETSKDIPFVGSLIKIAQVAINAMDWRYVQKLSKFLEASEDIDEETVNKFIDNLSEKDYKRISTYIIHLLYTSEEDGKAEIMGKIYRARLLNKIDNDTMLRLCSVVNKCFLPDISHLNEYCDENGNNDYITDNLTALGLLQDLGNVYEEKQDGWESTGWGPTKHKLNEVGVQLLEILQMT